MTTATTQAFAPNGKTVKVHAPSAGSAYVYVNHARVYGKLELKRTEVGEPGTEGFHVDYTWQFIPKGKWATLLRPAYQPVGIV